MSTIPTDDNPRARWTIYILAGALSLVLLVVMLVAYRGHAQTEEAQAKADELASAIEAAGFTAPDTETLARVLGDDGGAVCADPGDLSQSLLKAQLSNGAAGPGIRPVRVDRVVVAGERLIIKTYCPEELANFDEFVDSLSFYDVVDDG